MEEIKIWSSWRGRESRRSGGGGKGRGSGEENVKKGGERAWEGEK